MTKYSISTLEKLSGIKAHTIRIWEQRYGVLKPLRTETNIRYYDDEQLKKLLNIVTLLHNGTRISKISKLSTEELNNRVTEIIETPGKEEGAILALSNQLISTGLALDLLGFESAFQKIRKEFNIEDTYVRILRPMLMKIGLLWTKNKMNPAQEHFLSNLVRQKLIAAIDALPLPRESAKRWLLFLPPNEHHEIGLLYAQFLLRKYGNDVLYLGANVPIKDIDTVASAYKPTHALFFVVKNMTPRNGQIFFDSIRKKMADTKIMYVGENQFLNKVTISESFIHLKDPESFRQEYLRG